eukprot:gene10344-biopygen1758
MDGILVSRPSPGMARLPHVKAVLNWHSAQPRSARVAHQTRVPQDSTGMEFLRRAALCSRGSSGLLGAQKVIPLFIGESRNFPSRAAVLSRRSVPLDKGGGGA